MARILMRQISEPAVKLEPCKLYMYVCIKNTHTRFHLHTCIEWCELLPLLSMPRVHRMECFKVMKGGKPASAK